MSLDLKSEQSTVDLLVSMIDGVTQWPFPHWVISKVFLQLLRLKRLEGLIIYGTSLSFKCS